MGRFTSPHTSSFFTLQGEELGVNGVGISFLACGGYAVCFSQEGGKKENMSTNRRTSLRVSGTSVTGRGRCSSRSLLHSHIPR